MEYGQNLRVFVNNRCVAVATDCSFHVSVGLEDETTKDDAVGKWTKNKAVTKSWDVSCSTMYGTGADTEAITPEELMDIIIKQEDPTVTVKWQGTTGTKNRTPTGKYYSGQAYLNDATVNSPNRQRNNASFQFTGNGPLSDGSSSGSSSGSDDAPHA